MAISSKKRKVRTNQQILEERAAAYWQRKELSEGDFIALPDGTFQRVACIHGDSTFQTAFTFNGSFYWYSSGNLSFSGTLNGSIPKASVSPSSLTMKGKVWFFDQGIVGAGRRVDFSHDLRVWDCNQMPDWCSRSR